jgi:hypothetical protein
MMDANAILSEYLTKLSDTLQGLDKDCDAEFEGVGNAIIEIHASADSTFDTFVKNIVKLSDAIVVTRGRSDSLRNLPVLPYDLWLPFKSDTAARSSDESLTEAAAVFNTQVGDMASRWRPIAARLLRTSEPARFDQELLTLGDALLNHYSFSNNFCSVMPGWKRRLFAPHEQESTELFGRVIRVPVRSESEFKDFILALYKVFDESLPDEVRQWKKHKEDLPPLLLTIAEHVLDVKHGFYDDFTDLRNNLAHGGRDESEEKSRAADLSPIYEKLIGRGAIAPNDSERWLQLQKNILRSLSSVFDEMRRVFESAPTGRPID